MDVLKFSLSLGRDGVPKPASLQTSHSKLNKLVMHVYICWAMEAVQVRNVTTRAADHVLPLVHMVYKRKHQLVMMIVSACDSPGLTIWLQQT